MSWTAGVCTKIAGPRSYEVKVGNTIYRRADSFEGKHAERFTQSDRGATTTNTPSRDSQPIQWVHRMLFGKPGRLHLFQHHYQGLRTNHLKQLIDLSNKISHLVKQCCCWKIKLFWVRCLVINVNTRTLQICDVKQYVWYIINRLCSTKLINHKFNYTGFTKWVFHTHI